MNLKSRTFRQILGLSICLSIIFLFSKMNSEQKERGPIVELDVGLIEGINVKLDGNISMDIFYGVPFAEPPIGENRFEKTVPVKPWKDVKITVKAAHFCSPISDQGYSSLHSEDCLYLNVFRPSERNKLSDILFMVHGGGFEEGNSARYANIEEVGRKFVSKGIIVVAIQYRLAVLGFASTGDNEMPGNLGYWDQLEALKFIHRNAKAFNGDPNKITIYGSSAGGASVCALSISPHSKKYVHQVISASGSVFGAWATSENVVENTKQLIYAIGIDTCETVKECLKKAPLSEIYRALKQIGTTSFGVNFVKFGPRFDGKFFPKDYPMLIKESKPKPILIGCSEEESLLWTLVHESNTPTAGFTIDLEKRPTFSEADLQSLVRAIFPENLYTNSVDAQAKVLDFYLENEDLSEKNNVFYLQKYTQIFSDLQFNIPIVWEILLRSKKKWPVYAYKTVYVNSGGSPNSCPIKSAFHGSDQRYLILGKGQSHYFEMNEDDKAMEKLMVDSFVNFIKFGNPSSPTFKWKSTKKHNPFAYAELKPNPEMKNGLFVERVKFWTEFAREFNFDPVRMVSQLEGENSIIYYVVNRSLKYWLASVAQKT